ncbi:MAG: ferrous iron transport protein B [Deltaproteobacteria bacterium]|nr:ferrous iron transport protein B [Candidatus Anaeroferrophillus wilburensis]MBN2889407.1 ferrous iron transport protein B [Deltaproteobacteria bacterium]
MDSTITVALAGNPNSGKSTIFNLLTGSRQRVGNYPGVTVEKKEGGCRHQGQELTIIDLPGTYSLSPHSVEELVTQDFLLNQRPQVVIDIVDASNLERNLLLATQLMEMNTPLIIVLNMMDMVARQQTTIDLPILEQLLGVPVIPMVGSRGTGKEQLLETIIAVAEQRQNPTPRPIAYQQDIEEVIAELSSMISTTLLPELPRRWLAIKLLERDGQLLEKVSKADPAPEIFKSNYERIYEKLSGHLDEAPELLITEWRYGFIAGLIREATITTAAERLTFSDKVDKIILNRILGLPIFLLLMYLVFTLTFRIGGPPMIWLDTGFSWLGDTISSFWPGRPDSAVLSLLVDGIIGGVGGVLVFLPTIILLFFAIAMLEGTGYMARAAFIMDRMMHKIGLHGKSFIPLLTGFGCSVPAIMATRTLEDERDRLTTIMVTPLMSCGARLPIYALIIPAFFPATWQAPMLWLIYVFGIALMMVTARFLRATLFKGDDTPFVMELPPYRLPTLKSIAIHTWDRAWLYLRKAGTIILAISIVMWAMTTYPTMPASPNNVFSSSEAYQEARLTYSAAGRLGHALEPLLKPLGFDWRIGTALIGAFAAKEVFVSQLGIVYAIGEADEESVPLREKLQQHYTPLVGFCIMLFCLISAPCMATIAVTRRETNSWRWALFQLAGLTVMAWIITFIVYQAGRLAGIGC